MPTLLITSKMNPALAARVERAVTGSVSARKAPISRRLTSFARFAMVITVAIGIWGVLAARRREKAETERARGELLAQIGAQSNALDAWDKDAAKRAELWIGRLAAAQYEGDVTGAPSTALDRETLYVRGPLESFRNASLRDVAAASQKDAFLICMASPPTSRDEKVLLDKVRMAYLGGAPVEETTSKIRRLNDVVLGLPYLQPQFEARVRNAPDRAELTHLRADFEHVSFVRTRQAAKADRLLIAIDEPGDGKGPTELDGERSHFIRVALIDLRSDTVLLRARRHVDPSWISPPRRPTYAGGLDACALAFDLHTEVVNAGKSAPGNRGAR